MRLIEILFIQVLVRSIPVRRRTNRNVEFAVEKARRIYNADIQRVARQELSLYIYIVALYLDKLTNVKNLT